MTTNLQIENTKSSRGKKVVSSAKVFYQRVNGRWLVDVNDFILLLSPIKTNLSEELIRLLIEGRDNSEKNIKERSNNEII